MSEKSVNSTKIDKLEKIIYRFSAYIGAVSYICTLAIMVLNIADVIMTKFFQANIQGAYELTERLLMILVFACLAYGEMNDAHVHTTLFIAKLPRTLKFIIFGIVSVLATGASGFWAYALRIQIAESIRKNTVTDVLKIPLYPFYIIAFICVIILTVCLAWHMIKVFLAIRNDQCAEEVTKSWA